MGKKVHGKIESIVVKPLETTITYEDGHIANLKTFDLFGHYQHADDKYMDPEIQEDLSNYEAIIGSVYRANDINIEKRKTKSTKDYAKEYGGLNPNIVNLFDVAGILAVENGNDEVNEVADKQVYDLLQAYSRVNSIEQPMKEGDQELLRSILTFELEGIDKVTLKEVDNGENCFSKKYFEGIKEEIINAALCCDTAEIAKGVDSKELYDLIALQDRSKIQQAMDFFVEFASTIKQKVKNIVQKIFNENSPDER